jgi:hypothetical protein
LRPSACVRQTKKFKREAIERDPSPMSAHRFCGPIRFEKNAMQMQNAVQGTMAPVVVEASSTALGPD